MSVAADPRILAGLKAQTAERDRLLGTGAQRLGWKAGFGTAAAMRKLGTSAPLVGFLTDRTLLPDGATCGVGDWSKPTLEPEIAVRLGRDVEPGSDHDTTAAAVDALAPAIELVDLGPGDDIEAILSGNIFHRAVLLGSFAARPALDEVRIDVDGPNGPIAEQADPRDVLGDLADVVRRLADQIALTGTKLQAGDVVITGAAVPAVTVAPGERYVVRARGLGSVSIDIGA